MNSERTFTGIFTLTLTLVGACSSHPVRDNPPTLFEKYGGAPTVIKLTNDTTSQLGSDCVQAAYFTKVGTPAGVSFQQVVSCLNMQYTALLGGPATYPGKSPDGFDCRDMRSSHSYLGIPRDVFDASVVIIAGVFRSNGFSEADTQTVVGKLSGFSNDITSGTPEIKDACDGGRP